MATRMALNGEYRLFVDGGFRDLLHRLAQQRWRADVSHARTAVDALLAHQYVVTGPHAIAEGKYQAGRLKRCRTKLKELQERLDAGQVRFSGIEAATGQPELTSAKLRGHGLVMLDIAERWLIVRLDRHPGGGKGSLRVQYWLYDSQGSSAHLLRERENVARANFGPMFTQKPDGTWVPVSTEVESTFVALLRAQLGDSGAAAVLRAIGNVEDELLSPLPEEIVAECLALTGIDIAAAESRASQDRGQQYEREFGPRTGQPGIALAEHGARIHITPLRKQPKGEDVPRQ